MTRPLFFALRLSLVLLLFGLTPSGELKACTLWGAAGADARAGTIVSKNRDWKPDHVQVLETYRPEKGYAYFGLYAEGNNEPGLKQGINEKGLAAATATASAVPEATRKAQPGKSGLLNTLLAGYATCDEVLADQDKLFTNRRPVFAMVSDRRKILMVEVGLNGRYAVKVLESGTVAHSNHYLEEAMQEFNIKVGASSTTRVGRIAELLKTAAKPYDTGRFAAMSRDQHDGPNNSLWRTGTNGCTLSSWIVETPAQGAPRLRVLLANPGRPEELRQFVLDEAFWGASSLAATGIGTTNHPSPALKRTLSPSDGERDGVRGRSVEAGSWKETPAPSAFQSTQCEGVYPGHLQGICTDEREAVFWSWTDTLVKTDARGRVLKQVKVAKHHGDLCFHDGKVYVAVNLGQFNLPAGHADSWVFVYDADTLAELARHRVPEVVHGAGGIGYHDGRFIVVGGLPAGVKENYLYEYDEQFAFQQRHVLASGYTLMGIQTATFANGAWWFGCYGVPPVLLRADSRFALAGRWQLDAALGIVGLPDGRFLIGQNSFARGGGYEGRVALARLDGEKGLVFEHGDVAAGLSQTALGAGVTSWPAPPGEALSEHYELTVNGQAVPVHACRVSAVPFNQVWPGYQRPLDQTELAGFAFWDMAGPVKVVVQSRRPVQSVVVRPASLGIRPTIETNRIAFSLQRPGSVIVEVNGSHNALHLFASPPETDVPAPEAPGVRYFGPGVHRVGQINLHSNETVYISGGAVVYGSVIANGASHIRIAGRGILDVSPYPRGEGGGAVRLSGCSDVRVEGIVMRDPDVWCCSLFGCRNVRIADVKLVGLWRYNADGIDVCNSQDVEVRDCFVRAFDDALVIKGLKAGGEPSRERPAKNITFRRCVVWCDWGRAMEIGAETCAPEIAGVLFQDCDIVRTTHIGMDIQHGDRAAIHDIRFENVRFETDGHDPQPRMQTSREEKYPTAPGDGYLPKLMEIVIYKTPYSKDSDRGTVRNVIFRDIAVTGPQMPPSSFRGFDAEHGVEGVTISNLRFNGQPIASASEALLQLGPYVRSVEFTGANAPARER